MSQQKLNDKINNLEEKIPVSINSICQINSIYPTNTFNIFNISQFQ